MKIGRSKLLVQIFIEFGLTLWIRHSRSSYRTISPQRCSTTYLCLNLIFNCVIHLMVRILDLTTNEIFHTAFWHLKATQQLLCFWVCLVFVCSLSWIFMSYSIDFTPPLWKNDSLVAPQKNLKILFFPSNSTNPHRVTETGCGKASDISQNLEGRSMWNGVAQKVINSSLLITS